jgi:hypothetical protein
MTASFTGGNNMTPLDQIAELNRLRNRHVGKLLERLGEPAPVVKMAIKKAFSMFVEDVLVNVLEYEPERNEEDGE